MKLWLPRTGKVAAPGERRQKDSPKLRFGIRPEHWRAFGMAYALCVILYGIILFQVFVQHSRKSIPDVPAELVGYWTTAASGYAGRALEFTQESVIFHTGETGDMRYAIDDVSADDLGHVVTFTVKYGGRDQGLTLAVYYTKGPSAQFRLKNQQHITWVKQNSS